MPGTKMAFPGIKKPQELADILAYLDTFSDGGNAGGRRDPRRGAGGGLKCLSAKAFALVMAPPARSSYFGLKAGPAALTLQIGAP